LLVGGIASGILGRPRWTHDLDLFVRPQDARPMLRVFADASFRTEEEDRSACTRPGSRVCWLTSSSMAQAASTSTMTCWPTGAFESSTATTSVRRGLPGDPRPRASRSGERRHARRRAGPQCGPARDQTRLLRLLPQREVGAGGDGLIGRHPAL
jgi:hypothetical protein